MRVVQKILHRHLKQKNLNETELVLNACRKKYETLQFHNQIGGTLATIELDNLVHDSTKIRFINEAFVRKLLVSFTERQHLNDLTPLIAVQSEDQSSYMIIDGNHRLAALKFYKGGMRHLRSDKVVNVQVRYFPFGTPMEPLRKICAEINNTNDNASGYCYLNYVSAYLDFVQNTLKRRPPIGDGYMTKVVKSPAFNSSLPPISGKQQTICSKIATFIFLNDQDLHVWNQLRHVMPTKYAQRFVDVADFKHFEDEDRAITAFAAIVLTNLPNPSERQNVIERINNADEGSFTTQLSCFLGPIYSIEHFKPTRKQRAKKTRTVYHQAAQVQPPRRIAQPFNAPARTSMQPTQAQPRQRESSPPQPRPTQDQPPPIEQLEQPTVIPNSQNTQGITTMEGNTLNIYTIFNP